MKSSESSGDDLASPEVYSSGVQQIAAQELSETPQDFNNDLDAPFQWEELLESSGKEIEIVSNDAQNTCANGGKGARRAPLHFKTFSCS